jgi:hypothetical protein
LKSTLLARAGVNEASNFDVGGSDLGQPLVWVVLHAVGDRPPQLMFVLVLLGFIDP